MRKSEIAQEGKGDKASIRAVLIRRRMHNANRETERAGGEIIVGAIVWWCGVGSVQVPLHSVQVPRSGIHTSTYEPLKYL
jgi:hypothetical protein